VVGAKINRYLGSGISQRAAAAVHRDSGVGWSGTKPSSL